MLTPGWGLGSGAPCGPLRHCRRPCRRSRVLQRPHLPHLGSSCGLLARKHLTETEPNTRFPQKYLRTRNWSPQDTK